MIVTSLDKSIVVIDTWENVICFKKNEFWQVWKTTKIPLRHKYKQELKGKKQRLKTFPKSSHKEIVILLLYKLRQNY